MPARIWVDADACPNVIKEMLLRAAERTGVRDFIDTMRSSINVGGGPLPPTQAERNAFAGAPDGCLVRRSAV